MFLIPKQTDISLQLMLLIDLFIYFPKKPYTGIYPMNVGIVSKLALWYSVAIHLKLTVKTHNLQVQA